MGCWEDSVELVEVEEVAAIDSAGATDLPPVITTV